MNEQDLSNADTILEKSSTVKLLPISFMKMNSV